MKTTLISHLESKGLSMKDFENLGAEKQIEIHKEVLKAQQNELTEAFDAKADKETIDNLKAELSATKESQAKSINDLLASIGELGISIKRMNRGNDGHDLG